MTSLLSLSSAAPAVVLVPDLELLGYMAVAPSNIRWLKECAVSGKSNPLGNIIFQTKALE